MKDGSNDALKVKITCNDESQEVTLYGGKGFTSNFEEHNVGGLYFNLAYGSKNYTTPFRIMLRDFQLERYPGSQSPSSFAAEVTVKDGSYIKDHRIFMNNVLDYRGYRFFQSSYDHVDHKKVFGYTFEQTFTFGWYDWFAWNLEC